MEKREGLEVYSLSTSDPALRISVGFDYRDQVALLRGPTAGYGSGSLSLSWLELVKTGRLPEPTKRQSEGSELVIYEEIGLAILQQDSAPVEFILLAPEWIRLIEPNPNIENEGELYMSPTGQATNGRPLGGF